jgi:hypothetical protein
MANIIDEERRHSVDAAPHAAKEIVSGFGCVFLRGDRLVQLRHRLLQRRCQREEKSHAQPFLFFIERVVHFPEPFMLAGEFRSFGGGFGERMDLGPWEMPEDES